MIEKPRYDTVFIYDNSDRTAVKLLGKWLRRNGFSVLLPKLPPQSSKDWEHAIVASLSDSATYCICIGARWFNSKASKTAQRILDGTLLRKGISDRAILIMLPMNTVPKPDTLAPYSAFGTTIEFTQSIEDSQALQQLANAITALSPKPAPDPTAFTTNKTDTDLPELAFLLTLDGHLAPEDLLSFNRPAIDKAKQAASVASPKIDDIFSELRGRFGEVEAHPLWRAWIQRSSPGER